MLPKFAEITRGSCNFSSSSFSYFSFSFFSFFSFSFFSSFSPVTPGHPCHPGEPPRRPGCCCCLLQMIIQTPEGPASCKWSSGRTVGLVRYWIRIRKLGIQFEFRYNQDLFLCVVHPIYEIVHLTFGLESSIKGNPTLLSERESHQSDVPRET